MQQQIMQSSSSASSAGDVLLTTIPTQQLGFGNITYADKGLSDEQKLCAASCDKPLPSHQDEIVECLKSCGVSQIWERDTNGMVSSQEKLNPSDRYADNKPSCDVNKLIMLGAGVFILYLILKRR